MYRDFYDHLFNILLLLLLSVAGIVAVKPARRAAAATLLATAAPSASTKTGSGITSSAVQDFKRNPNRFLPSRQPGSLLWQQQQPHPGFLPGSRPLTVRRQFPVLVGKSPPLFLAPPPPPPQPQPPRPTDTRRRRGTRAAAAGGRTESTERENYLWVKLGYQIFHLNLWQTETGRLQRAG